MALSFIKYIRTLQHPTDTVTATLILAKRIFTGGTNFQELRASFDQMRPCISHYFASLASKSQDQTNIGSALKSSERHHWKSACFSQYDKNSEANLFSKPLPVGQLPPDTQVYRSVNQPKVKNTDITDMWQFIARHCANGAGMQKGIDYVESYAPRYNSMLHPHRRSISSRTQHDPSNRRCQECISKHNDSRRRTSSCHDASILSSMVPSQISERQNYITRS
eukprot:scaffold87114_cov51-Attheya_sp.AAC.1